MKNLKITLVLAMFAVATNVSSQNKTFVRLKKVLTEIPWLVEVGTNVIDDDGDGLRCIYKLEFQDFSVAKFPSRIAVEKILLNGFRIQLSGNYNMYKAGTVINRGENAYDKKVYCADLNLKYGLRELIRMNKHIDPYVLIGYGYTKRGTLESGNNNFGFGTNVCLYKNFGINLQAVGKWTMTCGATNYLQYTAGIVYKIGNGDCYTETEHHIRSKKHIRSILNKAQN